MTVPRSLELLAPAKNAAFGCEAIKHGADAVYIGGPAFGARYGAGSSVAEIQQLCKEFGYQTVLRQLSKSLTIF